mmetsp:Transcript_7772/g.6943  ORF Transcript_7772/g.6943 Transcript_7772/m.6943 type:complete len:237 (+) Transcript_7772:56-766(+)
MAIDHGLQGKNNDKSKRRRFNKARKTKAIALSSINKDGKVVFNEESRQEFLTGFRKRKLERRKFGLAMQIMKDKKSLKQKAKEKRDTTAKAISNHINETQSNDSDDDEENIDDNSSEINSVIFDDPKTNALFGSSVSVTIDDSIAKLSDQRFHNYDDDDRASVISAARSTMSKGSSGSYKSNKERDSEIFQRALKKATVLASKKKSKKRQGGNFNSPNSKKGSKDKTSRLKSKRKK